MAVDPGWYPDGSGLLRYWDGQAWTEHTHAPAAPAAPQPAPTQQLPVETHGTARSRGLSGGHVAALVGAGVLALAGVGLMLVPTLTGAGPRIVPAPSSTAAAGDSAEPDGDATVEATPDALDGAGDPTVAPAVALEVPEITAESAPADVAVAWAAAWNANDCPAEHALSTEELTWGLTAEEYCDGIEPTGDEPVLVAAEVIDESTTGDSASVTVLETVDWGDGWTSDSTTAYTLTRTEDGWRVSDFEWVE